MNFRANAAMRKARNVAAMLVAGLTVSVVAPSGFSPLSPSAACAAVETPTCWKLAVTPDDTGRQAGRDAFVEFIMFDNLGFTAEALAKMGFESSVIVDTGDSSFSSTSASDDHGTTVWTGTVSGDRISGTMVWTRDGESYTYTFAGGRHNPD